MKKITHALLRKPGKSFVYAISPQKQKIDVANAIKQHAKFESYLKSIGIEVEVLEADEKLPDGCFVDDAAVVIEDILILCFSANPKRQGEAKAIKKALGKEFKKIIEIKPPAFLDGGDLLFINNTLHVGLSKRTNKNAVNLITKSLQKFKKSITVKTIPVTKSLHLKSSVNYIGENILIINSSEIDKNYLKECTLIDVKNKRPTNANCVNINNTLAIAKGSSFLKSKLENLQIPFKEFDISEFKKAGGGINGIAILY